MRRSRLPSDSPSSVTRPGVKRISIALWVTSIHAGIASGRQFTKSGGGRPAFSSASWCATSAAALAFHGGMLVLAWTSWSVIFGFHTPLQSGSFARSAQSLAAGGGLMIGFSGSAAQTVVLIASKRATYLMDLGYQWSWMQCETRPAAESNHADPQQKRRGPRDASRERSGPRRRAPMPNRAPDAEMKDRHVDPCQAQEDELGLEAGVVRVIECIGGEEQAARNHGAGEGGPGAGEHIGGEPRRSTLERGEADQPQVEERDGSDDRGDGEHMKQLDPRKQRLGLADHRRDAGCLQCLQQRVDFHQ